MITRSICFRFDVDTPRCLVRGMPALLDLAKELDVRFTFYVNTGRAVLRRLHIKTRGGKVSAKKLSALRKLGPWSYIYTAVRNPRLAEIDRTGIVARAVAEGHDVGLHGGRNHAEWQRHADTWSEAKTRAELDFGMDALRRLGVPDIASFASPGWNTPPGLAGILPDYGIRILADSHGTDTHTMERTSPDEALQVPTAFAGEPGGIGYLEWLTARGMDRDQALSHFAAQLDAQPRRFAILYDHPCFAGIEALALLREMVVHCKRAGTDVMTLAEIVDAARSRAEATGDGHATPRGQSRSNEDMMGYSV